MARLVRPMLWTAALVVCAFAPAKADDCAKAGTQTDLNLCAERSFEAADAALNTTYAEVQKRLADATAKALLVVAQRRWLAFRDGECEFETALSIGGSARPMAISGCRTKLTEARTQALKQLLHCDEGDLACPIPPR